MRARHDHARDRDGTGADPLAEAEAIENRKRARVERVAAQLVAGKFRSIDEPDVDAGTRQHQCRDGACGPRADDKGRRDRTRPRTSALFLDPNPRQLQSAASTSASRALFGMKSMSHAGSWSSRLIVGGSTPRVSAIAVTATPAAPLAPWGCPIIDFVDDPGTSFAWRPKTRRTQRDSIASFNCVDVPW